MIEITCNHCHSKITMDERGPSLLEQTALSSEHPGEKCLAYKCDVCSEITTVAYRAENDDEELFNWLVDNFDTVIKFGTTFYAKPHSRAPIRKALSFRAAIRLARQLRTEWLAKTAASHTKAQR
jgi:hypothetical protein